jgi:lipoyl synthase
MGKRKPNWLKAPLGGVGEYSKVKAAVGARGLHTVCDEARCPNRGVCWSAGTATFLIMGDTCTRSCRFCAVASARQGRPLDAGEPQSLAAAASELGLKYVVLTSVDRDDLPDKGAGHFADCIRSLKGIGARVEALIPDYGPKEMRLIVEAAPDVIAHNIEVVERLQGLRDSRASYARSISTLKLVKLLSRTIRSKSSLMLGLGETEEDLMNALADLRRAGVDQLVLGQYLQPTRRQAEVVEYVPPQRFDDYRRYAKMLGFKKVVSEPLARTSYKAAEHG